MKVYFEVPDGLEGLPLRLRYAASLKGISQTDICKETGVSTHTVSFWFTGKYEPRLKQLCKIAKMLGVSTDWLLGMEDSDADGEREVQE